MTMLAAIRADITTLQVDAVVNAANASLLGGGGVDGALHAAAGSDLLKECRSLGGCAIGDAKITQGYRLPASRIIHTVSPIWSDGRHDDERLLAACYATSLRLARSSACKRIAFPCIGTGAHGFPVDLACAIAVRTVIDEVRKDPWFDQVIFCCFTVDDLLRYQRALLPWIEERSAPMSYACLQTAALIT